MFGSSELLSKLSPHRDVTRKRARPSENTVNCSSNHKQKCILGISEIDDAHRTLFYRSKRDLNEHTQPASDNRFQRQENSKNYSKQSGSAIEGNAQENSHRHKDRSQPMLSIGKYQSPSSDDNLQRSLPQSSQLCTTHCLAKKHSSVDSFSKNNLNRLRCNPKSEDLAPAHETKNLKCERIPTTVNLVSYMKPSPEDRNLSSQVIGLHRPTGSSITPATAAKMLGSDSRYSKRVTLPNELVGKVDNAEFGHNEQPNLKQQSNQYSHLNSDSSIAYIAGIDLPVMDQLSDVAQIDLISRFSRTPVSSSPGSCGGDDDPSDNPLVEQRGDSNVAQRPHSSAHASSLTTPSLGLDASKNAKTRHGQVRQQQKPQESIEKPRLPTLHLHLSKDGSSPLPPGWQRAPNNKRTLDKTDQPHTNNGELTSSDMYAYYYYHIKTRQTRWDPPVYPWDADPGDVFTGNGTDIDDPEAPYNWGCASKFAVTHDEIESMYARIRQRLLERQCTDLLHELAGQTDAPQGSIEHNFAIELFILVHNILRNFRDARCQAGRIATDEDLYYLTKKLAQAVILKEVQKFRQAQVASTSLFAVVPELNATVATRVNWYVRKYMESRGALYRRRMQQQSATRGYPPVPQQSQQQTIGTVPDAMQSSHSRRVAQSNTEGGCVPSSNRRNRPPQPSVNPNINAPAPE